MHDTATVVSQDDEHEEYSALNGGHGEEIRLFGFFRNE
jgi:hypothetical protein